eukprot:3230_1
MKENKKSTIHLPQSKNKFVTSNTNANNYSFGTQYRYTHNLSHHTLYIKPTYDSLKEELFHYFKKVNQQTDETMLLKQLLENANCMNENVQLLLLEINGNTINQKTKDAVSEYLKTILVDNNNYNHSSNDKLTLLEIVQMESKNYDMIENLKF